MAVQVAPALTYLVGTRLALFLVATAAVRLLRGTVIPLPPDALALPRSLQPWLAWDASWYLAIAERGYWVEPTGQSSVAFFPLFPSLIAGLALLVGNTAVAGLVIANVAAIAAAIVLWRWVREEVGPAAADDSVRWLMVYPFSFFLHAAYAESLFLLLALGTLYASRRHRWRTAAALTSLAALARPMGILLVPALAWGLWREHALGRAPRLGDWLALAMAPVGLLAYLGYLWFVFGDPVAFWRAHVAGWNVAPGGDLGRYLRELRWLLRHSFPLQGYDQVLITTRVLIPPIFAAFTVAVFRRLGPAAGIYTVLTVAVGTFYGFESVGREYLAAAPVFAVAGILGAGRQLEWLRMLSMGVLLVLLVAFVTGRFVG
jgi:hypothetical protein